METVLNRAFLRKENIAGLVTTFDAFRAARLAFAANDMPAALANKAPEYFDGGASYLGGTEYSRCEVAIDEIVAEIAKRPIRDAADAAAKAYVEAIYRFEVGDPAELAA